ncbi:hypothetical protein MJO28_009050 [Puccinia striiformis f. sp. tritici]|uniref:Uncharacterized protein n=1 Tax=Puccinia striiformis f. sp. tritici TaxID=168172 RepID=A0ACC0ECQ2_9BASI|nr:hypothetical protein MJO28_009050 [Puccinia striiformis f. sp. tritici]
MDRLPNEIKHRIAHWVDKLDTEWGSPELLKLALVDRTFNGICSRPIWQTHCLYKEELRRLNIFVDTILPRHSKLTKTLTMGIHFEGLPLGFFDDPRRDPRKLEHAEFIRRCFLQRQILESSPNLKDLGVYLETTPLDEHGDFVCDYRAQPTSWLLPQVSQLVNLTEIWLAPSWHQISFTEDFLVRLIRDMVHLEYFGCYGIDAKRICCQGCTYSASVDGLELPLARKLASLPSLVHLELGSTSCFDWNWSKIPWKGALSNIKLVDCWRASPGALHQFCMLFESSLTSLDLNNVPAIGDDEEELDRDFPEEASNQYQFRLPCLEFLSIRQLPVTFCELFRESHAIERLQIYKKKYMTPTDFDFFFEGRSWMNLRTLSIVSGVWDRKPEFISLADRGLRKGIQVELDEELDLETKTDYDSSDSEDSSSDEDI